MNQTFADKCILMIKPCFQYGTHPEEILVLSRATYMWWKIKEVLFSKAYLQLNQYFLVELEL